jgi:hypothetical protein
MEKYYDSLPAKSIAVNDINCDDMILFLKKAIDSGKLIPTQDLTEIIDKIDFTPPDTDKLYTHYAAFLNVAVRSNGATPQDISNLNALIAKFTHNYPMIEKFVNSYSWHYESSFRLHQINKFKEKGCF